MQNFLKNTSGNIGVLFALMAMPTIMVIGGSIDVLRTSNSQAKLQSAVDAGVLAAASLRNNQPIEEVIQEYIDSNIGNDASIKNLKITIEDQEISSNSRTVKIKVDASIEMAFLQFLGNQNLNISATAEAIEAKQNLEIALVLDISNSMIGSKMTSLKSAATEFVDTMLSNDKVDKVSISLVPFGGTVNVGEIFDQFAVKIANSRLNPNTKTYSINKNIPYGKFRFSQGRNCLELGQEDFNSEIIPANSRSQVPDFWVWAKDRPYCPKNSTAAIWNTNNAEILKKRIDEFEPSHGTGLEIGAAWGAKALSPSFRGKLGGDFSARPADFSDKSVQKIMILMGDGIITDQIRPENYKEYSVHQKPNQRDFKNQQRVTKEGEFSDSSSINNASGNYKAVCEDLREKGIIVYTIGFQIGSGSVEEKYLKYCATNPGNYYHVQNLDINKAFNAIITSFQKLRVSG